MLITCLLQLAASGCQVNGDYPRDWPEPAKEELVGKCPLIAGKFRNVGIGHPIEAGSLLLTDLLDLPNGDQVEITQSPERIGVAVWTDGKLSEEAAFTSVWVDPWAERILPRSFQCPIEIGIPGRRLLLFSHLVSQSFGIGFHHMSFSKAADGALIVTVTGSADRLYYRFEPVDH